MYRFGQNVRRFSIFWGGLLIALCLALSCTSQAQDYNAVNDFSITNGNPNGVWSYLSGTPNNLTLMPATRTGECGMAPQDLSFGGMDWRTRNLG